jgi:DNA-binding NarL/FixJ family response regulator
MPFRGAWSDHEVLGDLAVAQAQGDARRHLTLAREVVAGRSVIDARVVELLIAPRTRSEESPLSQLTAREKDVLREMAEGKTNAMIGTCLVLSESAAEST